MANNVVPIAYRVLEKALRGLESELRRAKSPREKWALMVRLLDVFSAGARGLEKSGHPAAIEVAAVLKKYARDIRTLMRECADEIAAEIERG